MDAAIVIKKENQSLLDNQKVYIQYLARLRDLKIYNEIPEPDKFQKYPSESIPSTGSLTFLIQEETGNPKEMVEKLERDLEEANSQIVRLETLLSSDFVKRAPSNVVEREKEKLAAYKETAKKIKEQLRK